MIRRGQTSPPARPEPPPPNVPSAGDDVVYLALKGARERLCRAQHGVSPDDSLVLQGAIDRIDLVACDLPQWSRHDGGRA